MKKIDGSSLAILLGLAVGLGKRATKTRQFQSNTGSANKSKNSSADSINGINRKKKFIVRSVSQGLSVIQHKDITDNWKKSLKVKPKSKIAVLLPCAATKPFSESPSHKHGYLKALGDKKVDLYIVSEPLGIVPKQWETKYPNADYDYPPKYLKGEARKLLSERIGEWFSKVYPKYDKVYSALPGHHQKLVNDSTDAYLENVTINQCRKESCF
jgi:predicted RNA-binding protein